MNTKGTFEKIPWIGFDRQRPGRRREFILKYRGSTGWRPVTAPREVTSEAKFITWALGLLRSIAELGEKPKRHGESPTVGELFPRWDDTRVLSEKVSGATLKNARTRFNAHILPRWKTTPVSFFDNRTGHIALREWIRELSTKVGPGHCHNIASSFSTFFRDIDLEGWASLRSNPMKSPHVTTVLPEETERRAVVVMETSVAQGLLTPHPRVRLRSRVRYALGMCTGANDGELCGCQIFHVKNLRGDAPWLEIEQAYKLAGNKIPKENGKLGSILGKTKNKYRVRRIPLNACARDALIEWLDEGWEEFVGRPWMPSDPLLPSSTGKFSRPRPTISGDLVTLGLPTHDDKGRPYEFRMLRRTFSTLLSAAGVQLETRERLMGQSSKSVNVEHYTAEVPAELRDAVGRLPFRWVNGGQMVASGGGETSSHGVSAGYSALSVKIAEPPRKVGSARRIEETCALVAGDADVVAIKTAVDGERHQDFGGDDDAEAFHRAVVEHRVSVEASALAMRPIAKASDKPARVSKRRSGGRR